jgi:hypothetical protein
MNIYTEVLSENKRAAFILALKEFPGWELKELPLTKLVKAIPLSREETVKKSKLKVDQILMEKKGLENGSIVLGIQKGVTFNELGSQSPSLIAVVSLSIKDGKSFSALSSGVVLPDQLKTLVLTKAYSLYEAYGEVFGEQVKNKEVPLYEFLTGKSEVQWFAEVITNVLLPVIGPRKKLF